MPKMPKMAFPENFQGSRVASKWSAPTSVGLRCVRACVRACARGAADTRYVWLCLLPGYAAAAAAPQQIIRRAAV
jgi:hypothetical protein